MKVFDCLVRMDVACSYSLRVKAPDLNTAMALAIKAGENIDFDKMAQSWSKCEVDRDEITEVEGEVHPGTIDVEE